MTTVIRYRTVYLINNISSLILSFALGDNVALRNVFGIPCLLAMGAVVDLVQGHLKCSELNQDFNLQLDSLGKGLPDGTNFDTSFTTVSDSVPSNDLPLSSFLQYTSSNDSTTPIYQQDYSNHLIVTDDYSQGCISRDLVCHSPTHNPSE